MSRILRKNCAKVEILKKSGGQIAENRGRPARKSSVSPVISEFRTLRSRKTALSDNCFSRREKWAPNAATRQTGTARACISPAVGGEARFSFSWCCASSTHERFEMAKYKLEYIWLDGYAARPEPPRQNPSQRIRQPSRRSNSSRSGASTAARPARPKAAARTACSSPSPSIPDPTQQERRARDVRSHDAGRHHPAPEQQPRDHPR